MTVPRVTGFQARGPDLTKLAGAALNHLQNATVLLTDAILPATRHDVKKEQQQLEAQIDALNLRLSAQQSVCRTLQIYLHIVYFSVPQCLFSFLTCFRGP